MKKNLAIELFVFVGMLALLVFSTGTIAGLPVTIAGKFSLAPILDKSMPAVVNIATLRNIQITQNPLLRDPFFRHFYQQPQKQAGRKNNSLGSGVIVNKSKGWIITNHHVIDKADEILVTLSDGREFTAKLIGKDSGADIAIIQIPANNLIELPLADSEFLQVGDFVVAIGNPFGLGQTVTSGIISALGRTGLGIEGYEDFIQTDASINPGNSGGALINLKGELIGINTAILAPNGGNVGIGFAIPTNMAMTIMRSLVEFGEVRRGLLGVNLQDLTPKLVKAFGLQNQYGVLISKVQSGSAADTAGLESGDIIVAIEGKKIKRASQIRNIIGLLQIDDKINLEILRDRQKLLLQAKIGKHQRVVMAGDKIHSSLQGAKLVINVKDQVEGVLIVDVIPSSNALQAGLRAGDIIISANRYRIKKLEELLKIANTQRSLLLHIKRGQNALFLALN